MPKFSVLMCFYGGEIPSNLSQAIDSILEQTLKPNEIILIQDGPISIELNNVVEFKMKSNSMIKLHKLDVNLGHGEARKFGLKKCEYDLVAMADSDDISEKTRFYKQVNEFVNDPDLSVVSSNLAEFRGSVDNIVSYKKLPTTDHELKALIKWKCPINQPSVMFRKNVIESVGGYIDWFNNEDYYLWIRLALKGFKFSNIEDCLVFFRTSENVFERRGGVKYFISEFKIQKLMLKNRLTTFIPFIISISIRFLVQVLFPNKLRAIFYNLFLRK